MFDLLPITIPMLMSKAKQDYVSLLAEVLGLLDYIDDHLFNWSLISRNFLLDQLRCLSLERMDCLSAVELTLDVLVVI